MWDLEKSNKLKDLIIKDEKLMRILSNNVSQVLNKHGIELRDMSYVFEPRVFWFDPNDTEKLLKISDEAMAGIAELILKEKMEEMRNDFCKLHPEACYGYKLDLRRVCPIPLPGPYPLKLVDSLEKIRISEINPERVQAINNGYDLTTAIVGNYKLLSELSKGIFDVLEESGVLEQTNINLEEEGVVFVPVVFESPIFAQKIGVVDTKEQISGFGPQVYSKPSPTPWKPGPTPWKPFPGIIERKIISESRTKPINTPGVIIDKYWWVGIPAPDLLKALDVAREAGMIK